MIWEWSSQQMDPETGKRSHDSCLRSRWFSESHCTHTYLPWPLGETAEAWGWIWLRAAAAFLALFPLRKENVCADQAPQAGECVWCVAWLQTTGRATTGFFGMSDSFQSAPFGSDSTVTRGLMKRQQSCHNPNARVLGSKEFQVLLYLWWVGFFFIVPVRAFSN